MDFQAKDGSEFCVNIFGEIQPESLGTKHSALGDFYIRKKEKVWSRVNLYYLKLMFSSCLLPNQPTYVTAELNIKDRFALGVPSVCTQKLSMMFQDQLVALNEIVKSEQDLEAAENKVCSPWEEFVRIH